MLPVLWVYGASGVGKTAVTWELFTRLAASPGIEPHSVEITIFETPRHNWGIRGLPGDELPLSYQVNV